MKRILVLSPCSVPVNSPESICNIKVLKALSDNGYIIDLISRDVFNGTYPPIYDIKEFNVKLNSVNCINVPNKINYKTIFSHILCFLKTGYVYKGVHWAYPAIKAGEKLLKTYKYDYIITRDQPSELVGLYLSKKFKVKLIVNWNDPYPYKRYPHPYGKGIYCKLPILSQKLLDEISKRAYCFTFPSERLRDYMLHSLKSVEIDKTYITPHIVSDDIIKISSHKADNKILRMIHAGNVSYPRNPENFIKGISIFKKKNPNAEFEISFIGRQDITFNKLINEYKVEDNIKIIPPMDYSKGLNEIAKYHVGIIIEAPCEEGIFLPTKVSDYIQCNNSIWTCSPDIGTLHDLNKTGIIEYYSNINSADMISITMEQIYSDFISGDLKKRSGHNFHTKDISETFKSILR